MTGTYITFPLTISIPSWGVFQPMEDEMQSQKISRRKALTGAGCAGLAVVVATGVAGAAQAMTPQERIEQHVEGIRQAFREIHPNLEGFGEHVNIDIEASDSLGSIVMLCAHLKV